MHIHRVDWYHQVPAHVKGILETLGKSGHEAYIVGGSVRDLWLGLSPKDFDLASSATPEEIEALFPRTEGVGRHFGIMIVVTESGAVEVARFRADAEYKDGRHPEHVVFSSPEEDAKRRDFTVNALFYDPPKGVVIDYVGGVDDLEKRLLRCVGAASLRFQEDSLRMLRAVRFHAQLAERGFTLDPSLFQAIQASAQRLKLVSRERITQELTKVLLSPKPSIGLADILQTGLWEPIFHCPSPGAELGQRLDSLQRTYRSLFQQETSPALFFSALAHWLPGWEAEETFVFSKETKAALQAIPALLPAFDRYLDLSLADRKQLLAQTHYQYAWTIRKVEVQGRPPESVLLQAEVDRKAWLANDTLDPPPLLRGADLLAVGFTPGPAVKTALAEVRRKQLDEELHTKEDALAFLRRTRT